MDDERQEAPADAGALTRRASPRTERVVLATAAAMLAPPAIAALAGSLGLAITLGVLSIFAGLLGFVAYVFGQEHWPRRPPRPRLPRARARLKS